MARTRRTTYRRDEVDEFDSKLRRFSDSLAQRERRMLREIIAAALEGDEDVAGFLSLTDDQLFAALAAMLAGSDAVAPA